MTVKGDTAASGETFLLYWACEINQRAADPQRPAAAMGLQQTRYRVVYMYRSGYGYVHKCEFTSVCDRTRIYSCRAISGVIAGNSSRGGRSSAIRTVATAALLVRAGRRLLEIAAVKWPRNPKHTSKHPSAIQLSGHARAACLIKYIALCNPKHWMVLTLHTLNICNLTNN